MRVDLTSGAMSEVSPTRFFVINRIEELPADEFLFSARETLDGKSRIFELTSTGEIKALTNDASDYNDVSMNRVGDRMVATQVTNTFRLQLAAIDDPNNPKALIAARSVSFAPDGRIVYSSDPPARCNKLIEIYSGRRGRLRSQFKDPLLHELRTSQELFLAEDFFDDFFGTLAPASRASDKPIAIACFLLVTFFPDRPLLSVPSFSSCIAFSTFFEAFLLYFAIRYCSLLLVC
jgi:hypothetical protein